MAAWDFRRSIADLANFPKQPPAQDRVRDDLPKEVRDFAMRGVAGQVPDGQVVRLRQLAEMEMKTGAGWQPLMADQTVGLSHTGFVGEAKARRGPVTVFRILDAYVAGTGHLRVRLLDSVPIVGMPGGSLDRGEAMRYLAEPP